MNWKSIKIDPRFLSVSGNELLFHQTGSTNVCLDHDTFMDESSDESDPEAVLMGELRDQASFVAAAKSIVCEMACSVNWC